MKDSIKIFGPATVSNVGPGFDLLGFALEKPGDELVIRRNNGRGLTLINESGFELPLQPDRNTAAVAVRSLLNHLKASDDYDIIFTGKIKPGSGIGSSAASCAAAVVGINELLGSPLDIRSLIPFAMEGELVSSGTIHADNIAPALLGGFVLIRGYDPLDIKHIPYPDDLWCALVHPEIEIKTLESRKLIPEQVRLKTALEQCGNLAGLIAGLATSDYALISRSVRDLFAEPFRTSRIPGFESLREKALEAGSIGTGLSGSGPSVFSLCRGAELAESVGRTKLDHFRRHQIPCNLYLSRVSEAGCRIV
ncbi:MAG: homoserine kinase [Bacteroidales bacterium]|nr:homoserine kinase [Bacteroidales bacterium]